MQTRSQWGAAGVKPWGQPSSADRRSARANDCGRRERRGMQLFGDLWTL